LALESYHRSRQDKEEITTRYDKTECDECGGTGKLPKCTCLNCDGLGYVNEEVIQRKVSGSPGDCSFLTEARNNTVEMAKLEGLYLKPEVTVQHVVSGGVKHTVDLEERFKDVDPELIIRAKVALARLEEAAKMPFVDGEVVGLIEEKK
jgi:DnaJ-class molecular chaperone